MTVQEAIQVMKSRVETATELMGKGIEGKANDDMEMPIEALQKQIPKKMLHSGARIPFSYYCPTCKTELSDDGCKYDGKCCFECGQALKRGEEDD